MGSSFEFAPEFYDGVWMESKCHSIAVGPSPEKRGSEKKSQKPRNLRDKTGLNGLKLKEKGKSSMFWDEIACRT
ncbi:MAG: hypothetical protein ACE361_16980 [Aureliella sp.]